MIYPLVNLEKSPVGDFWAVFLFRQRYEYDSYEPNRPVDHCDVFTFTDRSELEKWMIENKEKTFTVQKCTNVSCKFKITVEID